MDETERHARQYTRENGIDFDRYWNPRYAAWNRLDLKPEAGEVLDSVKIRKVEGAEWWYYDRSIMEAGKGLAGFDNIEIDNTILASHASKAMKGIGYTLVFESNAVQRWQRVTPAGKLGLSPYWGLIYTFSEEAAERVQKKIDAGKIKPPATWQQLSDLELKELKRVVKKDGLSWSQDLFQFDYGG
jgi:hypothetical protein